MKTTSDMWRRVCRQSFSLQKKSLEEFGLWLPGSALPSASAPLPTESQLCIFRQNEDDLTNLVSKAVGRKFVSVLQAGFHLMQHFNSSIRKKKKALCWDPMPRFLLHNLQRFRARASCGRVETDCDCEEEKNCSKVQLSQLRPKSCFPTNLHNIRDSCCCCCLPGCHHSYGHWTNRPVLKYSLPIHSCQLNSCTSCVVRISHNRPSADGCISAKCKWERCQKHICRICP